MPSCPLTPTKRVLRATKDNEGADIVIAHTVGNTASRYLTRPDARYADNSKPKGKQKQTESPYLDSIKSTLIHEIPMALHTHLPRHPQSCNHLAFPFPPPRHAKTNRSAQPSTRSRRYNPRARAMDRAMEDKAGKDVTRQQHAKDFEIKHG